MPNLSINTRLIVSGVYEMAGSAGAGLMVWAIGGIVATLCTLAYAELGKCLEVILTFRNHRPDGSISSSEIFEISNCIMMTSDLYFYEN